MTDERMSVDEALDHLARRAARTKALCQGESCGDNLPVLRAYIADTQEIVRLAREVVEDREHHAWKELDEAIDALRDRLEKHDA